jgi:2-oxoglutarate dehydrogenase E1 component
VLESLQAEQELIEPQLKPPPPGAARRVKTAIPVERLRELNQALLKLPDGFTLNSKLERAMQRRREALENPDESTIDWATAESLALASILEDGISIRLTGEDVERGTFSHRHAVFYDAETGDTFTPLQALPQARAAFEIHNSPLTENAVLGFEYGYNIQAPERLVIWEAQYGDFVNNAQMMIDETIASGRAKWEQTPSLVLLLPHGYEGQGPDHSSARPERFLQLAAEINMRIANCTTAAQYFHLLRRQAALLETDPLPLIVFTPKSLLRHPRVASSLQDLAEGGWQPVIDDALARQQPQQVRRLILCSGKMYVDLDTSEHWDKSPAIAIARVEQLYLFPADDLKLVLEGYPNLEEVIWVQEEPENMGAWEFVQPRLEELIAGRWPLHYLGRFRNSSPAEGSSAWHKINQETLIEQAYNLETDIGEKGTIWLQRT